MPSHARYGTAARRDDGRRRLIAFFWTLSPGRRRARSSRFSSRGRAPRPRCPRDEPQGLHRRADRRRRACRGRSPTSRCRTIPCASPRATCGRGCWCACTEPPSGSFDCPFVGDRITASQLRARITDQLGDAIARHTAQDGLEPGQSAGGPRRLTTKPVAQLRPCRRPPARERRRCCTRERPGRPRDGASASIATAAATSTSRSIVVDNAPTTPRTREVVAAAGRPAHPLRHVSPAPGLSRAEEPRRPRAAAGQIVAFTDDDVRVDASWLDALVRGFARDGAGSAASPAASCPPSSRPEAQALFDAKAGWGTRYAPAALRPLLQAIGRPAAAVPRRGRWARARASRSPARPSGGSGASTRPWCREPRRAAGRTSTTSRACSSRASSSPTSPRRSRGTTTGGPRRPSGGR